MPNLLKFHNKSSKVEDYNFNDYLEEVEKKRSAARNGSTRNRTVSGPMVFPSLDEEKDDVPRNIYGEELFPREEKSQRIEVKEDEEQDEPYLSLRGEEILQRAKEEAEKIIADAYVEAEVIKKHAAEESYKEGFEKGYNESLEKAEEEIGANLETAARAFLAELEKLITDTSRIKEELIEKYKDELIDVAIAIGEKVVQVSLKSSGSIIEKMIISATEKLKKRQWAKIYISRTDAELLIEGEIDILQSISHLSSNLKVIAMDNEKPGTLIIEMPDEIIDASASTQVENIKEIIKSTGI